MNSRRWRYRRMRLDSGISCTAVLMALALSCGSSSAEDARGQASAPMAPPEVLKSPFRIKVAPIFHWASPGSGQPVASLPSDDCRHFSAGLAQIDAAYEKTAHLTSFDASLFLEKTYNGQHLSNFETYVTDILLGYQPDGSANVHVGNELMDLVCGFEDKQTISAEWANAGVSNKYVYAPSRPLTLAEQFRVALFGKAYDLAAQSLTLRGLYPADSTRSITERCGIGLEAICQAHANAHCAPNEWGAQLCRFDWAAPEDELVVWTQVTSSPAYLWLSVIDVTPLPESD